MQAQNLKQLESLPERCVRLEPLGVLDLVHLQMQDSKMNMAINKGVVQHGGNIKLE